MLAIAVGQSPQLSSGRPPSRASSAPTGDLCWGAGFVPDAEPLWELSLLAIAVGKSPQFLSGRPPSRAGSLLQVLCVGTDFVPDAEPLWELSLLAIAVGQSPQLSSGRPPSQGFAVGGAGGVLDAGLVCAEGFTPQTNTISYGNRIRSSSDLGSSGAMPMAGSPSSWLA